MGFETLKTGAVGAALMLVLSACATTTDSADPSVSRAEFRTELPSEVYELAFANAMAEQIAGECRTLKYNRSAVSKKSDALSEGLAAKGYRDSDIRYLADSVSPKKVQDDAIQYIQKSGIVFGDPKTFCVAGRREIANKSAIGAFLKG